MTKPAPSESVRTMSPRGLCRPAQRPELGLVLENAEALRFQNGGVHHLGQGIFIVAALHHDDLPGF